MDISTLPQLAAQAFTTILPIAVLIFGLMIGASLVGFVVHHLRMLFGDGPSDLATYWAGLNPPEKPKNEEISRPSSNDFEPPVTQDVTLRDDGELSADLTDDGRLVLVPLKRKGKE